MLVDEHPLEADVVGAAVQRRALELLHEVVDGGVNLGLRHAELEGIEVLEDLLGVQVGGAAVVGADPLDGREQLVPGAAVLEEVGVRVAKVYRVGAGVVDLFDEGALQEAVRGVEAEVVLGLLRGELEHLADVRIVEGGAHPDQECEVVDRVRLEIAHRPDAR